MTSKAQASIITMRFGKFIEKFPDMVDYESISVKSALMINLDTYLYDIVSTYPGLIKKTMLNDIMLFLIDNVDIITQCIISDDYEHFNYDYHNSRNQNILFHDLRDHKVLKRIMEQSKNIGKLINNIDTAGHTPLSYALYIMNMNLVKSIIYHDDLDISIGNKVIIKELERYVTFEDDQEKKNTINVKLEKMPKEMLDRILKLLNVVSEKTYVMKLM